MSTPISNPQSYAQVSDLLTYRDWRQIADWISTNDSRGTQTELLTDPIVNQALEAASGEVEAYALRSGRYNPDDLAALTGVSQQYLIKLVCTLATEILALRKPRGVSAESIPGVVWAREQLIKLGEGEWIFGLVETQEAGLPSALPAWDYPERQPSVQAQAFFGVRD